MSDDFIYNDEFFLTKSDRARLSAQSPRLAFAFHDEQISTRFKEIDREANRYKRDFQRFGYATVALAFLALVLAVIEPIYVLPLSKRDPSLGWLSSTVAGGAAFAGIFALVIGGIGLGIGKRKARWMTYRLMGETIRQWQAQYRCAHVEEIVEAARADAADAFITARRKAFGHFEREFLQQIGGQLPRYTGDITNPPNLWLDSSFEQHVRASEDAATAEASDSTATSEHETLRAELFEMHDRVRFRAQVDYTSYQLRDGRFRSHPLTQERWLNGVGNAALLLTLGLHVAVIIGVFMGIEELKSALVHALAVIAALVALAVRVLEDGLQPAAALARLRGYLLEVREARHRYADTNNAHEKRRQMALLEEAAARELHVFMKGAAAARFVL